MAGYIGNKAVNLSTSGADISGTANLDAVDIDGAVNMATTALVTGVLTTTAATVFNGGFAANDGSTISTADNTDTLSLISTDADASAGPNLRMYRNSGSPADNDFLANIKFTGRNDNSQDVQYGEMEVYALDVSDGSEDGWLNFNVMTAGANTSYMQMKAGTGVVFNEDSNDIDFRVESNGNANMLFVDGGNDAVGIGCVPNSIQSGFNTLQIGGNLTLNVDSTGAGAGVYMGNNVYRDSTNSRWEYIFTDEASQYYQANGTHVWRTAASGSADAAITWSERMRITNAGNLLVSTTATEPATNNDASGISLQANGKVAASRSDGISGDFNTNTDGDLIFFRKGGTKVGSVSVNSSSTAYNTSSDYRLKTDVQPMTDACSRLLKLKPVNFQWLSDGTRVDGFLAHEAQAVVSECVTGTKDAMKDEDYKISAAVVGADGKETKPAVWGTRSVPDMQGLDQSKMVPLLVAALQEALARITALENA